MKQNLQALLGRPSTWLSMLSTALLILVLSSPEPEPQAPVLPAAAPPPPVREAPLAPVLAAPVLEKEEAGPLPLAEPPPARMVVTGPLQEAPEAPAIAAPVNPAPPAPPPSVAAQPPPPALPVARPIQGPPTPEQAAERWALLFVGPPLLAGPPAPRQLNRLVQSTLAGPPAPAELIRKLLAGIAGPPSPAEVGPPAPLLAAAEEPEKTPARGEDSEFAHGEEPDEKKPKLAAVANSGLQKPTTRITPPPSAPAPPKEPEPEPPPLSEEALPLAQGDVWKIVKVEGRDYVTGQSIQLFYRFNTHKVEGKHVWFRNPNLIIKAQLGSKEMLVNNIKFILSYPVLSHNGQALFSRLDLCKLIEPVIRPSYIGTGSMFDTVVLDAGHGGHEPGAKGVYGYEKNYTLAMVLAAREALIKRGFKVVLTRSNDTFLSLSQRVAIANRTPNSIFISIHFNSGGSAASGIETFALTPQGSASSLARGGGFSNTARTGNQFDSENIALATAVHAQVISRYKLIDRGIKRARWSVLSGCQRPGILFEGGFLTNSRECQLIASDDYRKKVAEAIGDAVLNYRRALDPRQVKR